jgi:hypothetical protein
MIGIYISKERNMLVAESSPELLLRIKVIVYIDGGPSYQEPYNILI